MTCKKKHKKMEAGGQLVGTGMNSFITGLAQLIDVIKNPMAYGASLQENYASTGEFMDGGMVNIEGEEGVQMPGMPTVKAKGPSHEQGGIDVPLPDGTIVYSKRVKKDGKTMMERKEVRDRKIKKIMEGLKKDPTNTLLKATSNAQLKKIAREELEDIKYMDSKRNKKKGTDTSEDFDIDDSGMEMMATGGTKGGAYFDPTQLYMLSEMLKESSTDPNPFGAGTLTDYFASQPTTGQMEAVIGNEPAVFDNSMYPDNTSTDTNDPLTNTDLRDASVIGGALSPTLLTILNRLGDKENVNTFANVGAGAMKELNKLGETITQQGATQLSAAKLAETAAMNNANANSRSINTSRALKAATAQNAQRAADAINDNIMDKLLNLGKTKSATQLRSDIYDAQGQNAKLTADQQDRDAFYTNLSKAASGGFENLFTLSNIRELDKQGGNLDIYTLLQLLG